MKRQQNCQSKIERERKTSSGRSVRIQKKKSEVQTYQKKREKFVEKISKFH